MRLLGHLEPLAMVALFALAVAIRLPGTHRALPYLDFWSWDEPFIMNRAIDAMRSGNWDPDWQDYPGGPIHLQTLVAGYTIIKLCRNDLMYYPDRIKTATDTKYLWTVGIPEIYLNARRFHVLLGGLTVLVAYGISKRFLGSGAAFATALLASVTPYWVGNNAVVKPDTPALLAAAVCLYFAVKLLLGHFTSLSYLGILAVTGGWAGVAAGMKYNAGIVLLVPWLAHILKKERPCGLLTGFAITGIGALAGFLLVSPHAFLRFNIFVRDFADAYYIYTSGEVGAPIGNVWTNLSSFIRDLWSREFGPLATILTLYGSIWLLRRQWRIALLLLATIGIVIYTNSCIGLYRFRNYLPAVLTLCVFFGAGVRGGFEVITRIANKKQVLGMFSMVGVVCLSCATPFYHAVVQAKGFRMKPDSRTLLLEELQQRFSEDGQIAIDELLHVYIPDNWKGPKLVITNLFNKPFQWFQQTGIRYVVLADRYEYPDASREDTLVTDFMNNRFASLRTIAEFGDSPLRFRRMRWNPKIALKEFTNYHDPHKPSRFLPAVAMRVSGRSFFVDTLIPAQGGVELFEKGYFEGDIDLDTTVTRMRLCGLGYWRHYWYPVARVIATKAGDESTSLTIMDNLKISEHKVYEIPCRLGPGRWTITVEFVNGEPPLPLLEEEKARRLGVQWIEFLP